MGVDTWREQLLWMYGSGVEGERGSYDGSTSLFNTALNENGRCMLNNPFAPKLEWIFTAGLGSLRKVAEAAASFLGDQVEGMWCPKVDCPSSSSHRLPLQTYAEILIRPFVGINWYELSSPASVAQDRRMPFSLPDSLAATCDDLTGAFGLLFGVLSGIFGIGAMNAAAAILSGLFATAGSVGGSSLFAAKR